MKNGAELTVITLSHSFSFQAALQEPERCYMLAKARGMVDGTDAIKKCPAAIRAKTPDEAKQRRVEAAPMFLRRRVEREEELPKVEVRREEEESHKAEELRAVAEHLARELKAELVVEVMEMLRRRWSHREGALRQHEEQEVAGSSAGGLHG